MFGKPWKAYVYFIYGMYLCFNVVTQKEGVGEAVLIRGLEPVEGIEIMQELRNKEKLTDLCSGPGKLCIAMGISLDHNRHNLDAKPLYIVKGKKEQVVTTTRIGIKQGAELPYRFYVKDNKYVSKK